MRLTALLGWLHRRQNDDPVRAAAGRGGKNAAGAWHHLRRWRNRPAARIAGTGIEVFEVIGDYQAVKGNKEKLRECFDWLSEELLNAAIAYYETYPEEIDERLKASEELERRYGVSPS